MPESGETQVTVAVAVCAALEKAWRLWTLPHHILHWNYASEDWHTTYAENDLREGDKFLYRMEPRNMGGGFDFTGEYLKVLENRVIEYKISDGRRVTVIFSGDKGKTNITETFETESIHPPDMQRTGWQSILNNFKRYAESSLSDGMLHFEIVINAPVEKVYKLMLDKKTYNEWTSAFNESSHFSGSWTKGSEILFLGSDADGKEAGMISTIKENIECNFVSIEHLGEIRNGERIMEGQGVEGWKGSLENYIFNETDGKTKLTVELDSLETFRVYFLQTYPKALEKLKNVCER